MRTETELTLPLLNEHPIWTWAPDCERYTPVADYDTLLSDAETLFIRSKFRTPGGECFVGCVTGYILDSGPSFYSFTLFQDGDSFGFNAGLPELNREDLQTLRTMLNRDSFLLFPLHYETQTGLQDANEFSGVFDWPTADA